MMSTILPQSSDNSLVLQMRDLSGNMNFNPSEGHSTFVSGELQIQLDMEVLVDNYNQYKGGCGYEYSVLNSNTQLKSKWNRYFCI